MTPELLIAEATKAAVGALIKETAGPALRGAGQVWAWITGKLTGPEAATAVAAMEADPAKLSAQRKLEGALAELLETHPELSAELERVLSEAGARGAVLQTMTTTGDGNQSGQIAGDNNKMNFRR